MLAGVRTLGVVLSGVPARSYLARYGAYRYAARHAGSGPEEPILDGRTE